MDSGRNQDDEDDERSNFQKVMDLAEENAEFFLDQHNRPYAAVEGDGKTRNCKISSKQFEDWLYYRYYTEHGYAVEKETVKSVSQILEGKTRHEKEQRRLYNRVALEDDTLWYDLKDGEDQAVKVTENGWEITQAPSIFKRFRHQKEQVKPEEPVEIDRIFEVLNPCLDEDQRLLFKVQLIADFIPKFPHPIVCPHGPQGSAKTSMHWLMRELIDPSEMETLAYTTNLKELTQKLSHHWFAPFDNISNLPVKVSDFFCRAVTGQGFSKRELYTDDSDIIYKFQRPIGLNGINTVTQKPDLLDRTVLYELERISREERKDEETLQRTLDEMKPGVLARIFEIISDAMEIKPEINLDVKPRMADFAVWGEAIARSMGYNELEFLRAYLESIEAGNVEAIESHIIGKAILNLMGDRAEWHETPSRTLEELNEIAEERNINTNQKKWPGGPQWVRRRLEEVKANLQEQGLEISYPREGEAGSRMIHIEWRENDVSDDSADSESDTTDSTDTNSDTPSKTEMPPKEEPARTIYKAVRGEDWTDIENAKHLAPGYDSVEVQDTVYNHSAFETHKQHDREEFRVKQSG